MATSLSPASPEDVVAAVDINRVAGHRTGVGACQEDAGSTDLLDRHQARALREYARRRNALLASLGRRMPQGVTWTETQGGFSLLLELPEGRDAAALLPRAIERGVAFTPGAAFYSDGGGERSLRLSFSAVPFGQIEEGVRRLADTIRETRRRPDVGTRERGSAVPLV